MAGPLAPISPAELLRTLLRNRVPEEAVPHVVVGPLSHDEQQAGGVSIATAGRAREDSAGLTYPRIQLRCLGGSLASSEKMANAVVAALHDTQRVEVTQDSTGDRYLVHSVRITGGPSDHFDTAETWEGLMFADVIIGVRPF